MENKFGRRDEEKAKVLVEKLDVESKSVRKRRRAGRRSVLRAKKKAERMKATVKEDEDEGKIEPTPICVVHAEFQIDEDNDGREVPA